MTFVLSISSIGYSVLRATFLGCFTLAASFTLAQAQPETGGPKPPAPEVRGTWVTTTANTAIANPANTAATMKRLRDIGLNTVYVECWKNGYTQYPSKVLERTIGVDRRPALMKQDPSDTPDAIKSGGRDLMMETLTEAHRNGLVYIAWFEYGFMAAHKDTQNHLRKKYPEWLSRDIKGSEVAPNGFVWMNPLHPGPRQFLLDLVLEAIDQYDLDGVQLDDRIVWPYYTMGYDDYTRGVYAKEHAGKQPPEDPKDPDWMRWRAEKINQYSKEFVQTVRARRPGIIISLSPAPYPWVYENYLLEWPKWAAWTAADGLKLDANPAASAAVPRWDEYVPQCYRMNYKSFETTWIDQVDRIKKLGAGRVADMYAGIRVVGDGPDLTWDDLKKSIELTRSSGSQGHVLWFSRGVLDVYPKQLTEFYDVLHAGMPDHPRFGSNWRPKPIPLTKSQFKGGDNWTASGPISPGDYLLIGKHSGVWERVELSNKNSECLRSGTRNSGSAEGDAAFGVTIGWDRGKPITDKSGIQSTGVEMISHFDEMELILDRRPDLSKPVGH